MLVAAVLRPEEREDGQLEMIRLTLEQLLDARVLPVREAELTVEWLFRDGAQNASLAAPPDGPRPRSARSRPERATAPHTATLPLRLPSRSRDPPRRLPPPAPLRDLGIVVPLHQARRRDARAVGRRFGRLVFGALTLLVLLAVLPGRGGLAPLRGHLWPILVLGALNNAVPFWLLGFAETHLDSGLTAVIQAAAPIFTVILASRMDVTQRVTGPRLIGVGVGFVGVALLVGVQRGGDLVAALAVLGVALCYAASVLFAGLTVRTIPPLQVSIGQLSCAAIMIAPFGLTQLPGDGTAGEGVARGARARRARLGHRLPPLLRDHRERRRLARDSRHLPRARVRARLRRRLPRRGDHRDRARRPRARPRRHGARDGSRPGAPSRSSSVRT